LDILLDIDPLISIASRYYYYKGLMPRVQVKAEAT
jgi:hypothetical protein